MKKTYSALVLSLAALAPSLSAMTVQPDPETPGGYLMYRSDLNEAESQRAALAGDMIELVKRDLETLANDEVAKIQPLRPSNPDNVKRVERILSAADFDYLFPHRAPEYTYPGFLQAIGKFPAFCGTYDDGRDSEQICKRALATTFAHFVQETGANTADTNQFAAPIWRQGLYWVREMHNDEQKFNGAYSRCDSEWPSWRYPCGRQSSGEYKSYFGRGAKQLSWNYNYGAFSEAMFGDPTVLLNDPAQVADTWLNFASAIWFYIYPQPPKPSMLHVIDGTWQPNAADAARGIGHGFGTTINIINGAFECGKGSTTNQARNRIAYYRLFSEHLGLVISPSEALDCANQGTFTNDGAGALEFYWDKDWGWDSSKPGGHTFACKVVGYQFAYNALTPGDYQQCVNYYFGPIRVIEDLGTDPEPVVPSSSPSPIVPTPSASPSASPTVSPTTTTTPSTTTTVTVTPTQPTCPDAPAAWSSSFNWSLYVPGELRSHQGKIYQLTGSPAFGAHEPGTSMGAQAWTLVGDLSCDAPTPSVSPTTSLTPSPSPSTPPSPSVTPSVTVTPSATVTSSPSQTPSVTATPSGPPLTQPPTLGANGGFGLLLLALGLGLIRRSRRQ